MPSAKANSFSSVYAMALLTTVLFALTLRLADGVNYPFHPDAAYMALKANQVYYFGHMFEPRVYPTYAPLWPYALAYAGELVDFLSQKLSLGVSGLDFSIIYMPPIFGSILVASTALLGRALYDWKTGVLAAFGVAAAPLAIALSSRGATDHDAFSLSLMVLTMAAFIMCARRPLTASRRGIAKTTILWLFPGILFTLSLLTWKGAIVLAGLAAVSAVILLVSRKHGQGTKSKTRGSRLQLWVVPYTATFFAVPTVVDFVLGSHLQGYDLLLGVGPTVGAIYHYFAAFFAGPGSLPAGSVSLLFTSVGEYQPLSLQSFLFLLGNFNVLAPLGVVAMLQRRTSLDFIALVLFIVPFVVGFRSTDFAYVSVPFVSVASGRFVVWLLEHRGGAGTGVSKRRVFPVFLLFILLIPVAGGAYGAAQFSADKSNLPIMPSYWFQVYDWMKTSTPQNSLIFSWWDYGDFTEYFANRLCLIDNSYMPDALVIDVAKTIAGTNSTEALQVMAKYSSEQNTTNVYYMITSSEGGLLPYIRYAATFNTTTGTGGPISSLPPNITSQTIYYRLYTSNATVGSQPIPGFTLAFRDPYVQVYQVNLTLVAP